MIIKQTKPLLRPSHTVESWKSAHFMPMTAEKKEELFHELAVVNKYPDLSLWYIESNREIRTPETRSFWREENWAIHVLDKYGNLKVHEAKYYPILVKKYSMDPNMIWVSENPKWKSKFWWKTENWIMLKEWNKKIPLKLKKIIETKEELNKTMKCEKMTPEEIKEFKNAKKSKEAKFFYEKDERYKPKNKIDLWNGKILYVSDRLISDYQELIWYIKVGDKLELRMFYKSKSEWAWRSCPWAREDWKLSKWEKIKNYCYETTTKVTNYLWELFDKLKEIDCKDREPIEADSTNLWKNILMDRMIEETTVDTLFSVDEQRNIILNELNYYEAETSEREVFEKLKNSYLKNRNNWKVFHDTLKQLSIYKDKNWKKKGRLPDVVKRMYARAVPKWLDYIHMKKLQKKTYKYNNKHVWVVNTDVYQMNRNWNFVNIFFSRAEKKPNEVWIDEVQYADAEINSFWIIKKSINAAPLTWKPYEYDKQSPYINYRKWVNPKPSYSGKYVDVRYLYQDNPIIKHYKKLEKLL